MSEQWRDITELNGDYQVSSLGRIRRATPCKGKGCKLTEVGKIVKGEFSSRGYMRLRMKHRGFSKYIHRIVAECFLPNPHNLPFIHHINHIKTDNRLSNLMWCSVDENNQYNILLTVDALLHMLDPNKSYTKQDLLDMVGTYRVGS